MDFAVVALGLAVLLMIIFHPATQMFIEYIKSKPCKKKSDELHKCYHTIGDCRDCTSSLNCPMKHENIIVPKRDEYRD